jgi:hypothetical protein
MVVRPPFFRLRNVTDARMIGRTCIAKPNNLGAAAALSDNKLRQAAVG